MQEALINNSEAESKDNVFDPVGDADETEDDPKHNANKELKEEMDLDFEEISDGELEEEAKYKGIYNLFYYFFH